MNISIRPSSIFTGKCTITSREGMRSIFHSPSSRFSLRAAKSKRAAWASQGLISCSRDTDAINLSNSVCRTANFVGRGPQGQTM